ncbi:hypothetical protein B9Z55_020585 [Caenorhabditis nigoni]|uniref:Apple domain-containing protein n=1 Tax=Caenorhabditis nigoni TaxID=1611254 RepID=A0A2G5TNG8_9PELO|nr:hypothetical protein B9Z55_020585 [Caenorhabditis nigoni]
MFHFHILLLGTFIGSTEASCRARLPGLDQNLTTVGPIIDDPQLTTTAVPDGNHSCLIPFLFKTEFYNYVAAKNTMTTTVLEECRNACLNDKGCVAIEFNENLSRCRTYAVGSGMSFRNWPCSVFSVNIHIKLILPTSEPCTPINLYKAANDEKIKSLESGEQFKILGGGTPIWTIMSAE